MQELVQRITTLKPHWRLSVGLGMALLALALVPSAFNLPGRIIFAWVGFTLTELLFMWTTISLVHPRNLPDVTKEEDLNRTLILAFVVTAAVASLVAIVALLNSVDDKMEPDLQLYYNILAGVAVASSWTLVHTIFTLRYAHLYYGDVMRKSKKAGGLEFPNDDEPDYMDFAYFSFVIGMTSQVSDVGISSKRIRRAALGHGVLSFTFNAVIIALTISGVSK